MSIKMKLLISYIGMILIPVVLIIFTSRLISTLISHPENRDIHAKASFAIIFQNQKSEQLYQLISEMIQIQPDHFADPDYLREFEIKQNLPAKYIKLIAKHSGKVVYMSSGLSSELSRLFNRKRINFKDWLVVDEQAYLFRHLEFFTQKGESCNLFILTNATAFYRIGKIIMLLVPLILILFIVITNGLLTYFMSRNIIRPLKVLQNATEQIKAGNLDFRISIHSRDELGKLAEAFEEMRSRLKESLETQMQYETNRKELIAGISHDLKTPVTSIKGYVEGILDGVAGSPEKLRHYLKTIQTKTDNLDKLIDELFLFSKLDLGRLPFQFEKIQLQKLVYDFYQELQLELDENNIVLRFEDDSRQPVLVMADREKLIRVIGNLVDNSLKYMSNQKQPLIVLGIKDGPDEVMVWVNDNGRGITSADLPFIFDSFFRADRTRNTDTGGSGLGLAIAKRIITGHGGRIWAESNPGYGTTISFSLPKL